MDLPRTGHRWLAIVWLGMVCLGTSITPVVQCTCDRTYARDVRCGLPVLHAAGLPKHPSEAVRGEFPWHVAIVQLEHRLPVYSCGGSLVTDRFVLTAAHCVVDAHNGFPVSRDGVRVQAGYHELHRPVEGCSQEVGVASVAVHPEFRTGAHRHDVALLELEQPVRFNDRVLPVCLDAAEEDATGAFYRGVGKVPGWGYTELNAVSHWLRMTEVPIVNYTRCLANNPGAFYQTIHDGMFCGGYANGTNVCNGDSGGGLVTYGRHGRWELQGIVSFTALRDDTMDAVCDTEQYAGFVKVRHYRAWIGSILTAGDWQWSGTADNRGGAERSTTSPTTSEALKALPSLFDCGRRRITSGPAIVNGVRSLAGQWPWHAAIFGVSKRSRRYLCGGTLVSANYILTSASCVTDWHPRKRPLVVQLGQAELWQSSLTGRDVRVLDVERSDDSAMALLHLDVDVQYDDHIQPICLPMPSGSERDEQEPSVGRNGTIVGYGQTDPDGDLSPFLQATLMPIVDGGLCALYRIFDKQEAHRMFCAGHGNGTNACKGDEGGGFYEKNRHGAWTLTGVIGKINLYRKRCDPYGYVGLRSVLHYLDWIVDRIRRALSHPGQQAAQPPPARCTSKGCRRRHHQHHQRPSKGSGESGSNEDSNESSRERSITAAVKNVMQAKVELVQDIHGAASSTFKKIFG